MSSRFPRYARRSDGRFFASIMLGAAAVISACSGSEATASCEVTLVAVSPGTAEIDIGGSTAFSGNISQTNCNPVPTVSWSTSAPAIASVAQTGVVTGLAAGTATITASAGGKSGTATLTVRQPAVASVQITSTVTTVVQGGTLTLTAVAKDGAGNTLAGRTITWQSGSPQILSVVAATGVATGVSAGTAQVTATSEGRSTQVTITVTPPPVATVTLTPAVLSLSPGATRQMDAVLKDGAGNVLVRPITWTSSAPAVVSVTKWDPLESTCRHASLSIL